MDGWTRANDTARQTKRTGKMNARHICLQINLQHSRLATDNLLKITQEERIDILCVKEPYTIGNKLAGLTKSLADSTWGAGRKWAAIVINNIKRHNTNNPALGRRYGGTGNKVWQRHNSNY
jgi:hypothetical protein